MTETEDKSPSRGGKEIEEINISSEGVQELRTQIPLSKGLREHFGEREPTEKEHNVLNMTQEYALYSIGLNRLSEWIEEHSDDLSDLSTALNYGDHSKMDMILDMIAEGSPWGEQQLRDLLINMALKDRTDEHHLVK